MPFSLASALASHPALRSDAHQPACSLQKAAEMADLDVARLQAELRELEGQRREVRGTAAIAAASTLQGREGPTLRSLCAEAARPALFAHARVLEPEPRASGAAAAGLATTAAAAAADLKARPSSRSPMAACLLPCRSMSGCGRLDHHVAHRVGHPARRGHGTGRAALT